MIKHILSISAEEDMVEMMTFMFFVLGGYSCCQIFWA